MNYDKDNLEATPDLNADSLKRRGARKRVCKYCADRVTSVDYKDPQTLRQFVTDRGKIVPRRISGNCAKHQRMVRLAVARARNIALMPFTQTN